MKIPKITFIILTLLLATSCKKEETKKAETVPIMVKTEKIITLKYAEPIRSAGIITSDKEARLSFKVSGIIEKMYVHEGDQVSKGQLLATLNQTEIAAQLQQAKNNFEKAKRDHARMENLQRDHAATAEEFENSATSLSTAKQLLDIARFNKQFAAIYANQSGSVIKKEMNEGEIADAGVAVYTINAAGNNDWIISIGLSDKEWVKLKKDDAASITTDAYGTREFAGYVYEIGSGADATTGTFLVKIKIKAVAYKFASGLAAKVRIFPSDKKTIRFIPASALVEVKGNTAVVYTANPDKKSVTRLEVQVAFTEGNRIGISAGLENADNVITDGSAYLSPNSKIKI